MPAAAKAACMVFSRMVPATTHPCLHSAVLSAVAAKCAATREAEHAESTGKQGPVSPSTYEMRPDAIDMEFVVPSYSDVLSLYAAHFVVVRLPWLGSSANRPTNTPTGEPFRSNLSLQHSLKAPYDSSNRRSCKGLTFDDSKVDMSQSSC